MVGFGLSNDERRGMARDFDRAFAIARDGGLWRPARRRADGPGVGAGLPGRPAGGAGRPRVRAAEDPRLLRRLAERGVTCEVCPASNVALGVYERHEDVPLRTLFDAGVPMALGADDPLLFGSRLAAQYEIARRHHGFTDAELAELARQSVRGSAAPEGYARSCSRASTTGSGPERALPRGGTG